MDMTLYITQNTRNNSLCYSKGQIPNPLCPLSHHLHYYSVMAHASARIGQSLLALWLLGMQPKNMDGVIQDKQLIFMLSSPPKQGKGEARNCEMRSCEDLKQGLYSCTWQHGRCLWVCGLDKARTFYTCEKTYWNWREQLSAVKCTLSVLKNNRTDSKCTAQVPSAVKTWHQIFQGCEEPAWPRWLVPKSVPLTKSCYQECPGTRASIHSVQLSFPL